MTESALAWTEETSIDTHQPLSLFQEMSGLTLSIVCKALFGTDLLAHKERVLQASTTINHTVLISSSFDRTWLSGHKREASELTKLADAHLVHYAVALHFDEETFKREMTTHVYAKRVREDFLSGVRSGVNGTPTFYIDGVRHDASYALETLLAAIDGAMSS
jgi:predicted DsbA family dithiol-disulfide isomerase